MSGCYNDVLNRGKHLKKMVVTAVREYLVELDDEGLSFDELAELAIREHQNGNSRFLHEEIDDVEEEDM